MRDYLELTERAPKRARRYRGRMIVGLTAAMTALFATSTASAFEFGYENESLGDLSFTWNNRVTAGVQMRTESRDAQLIDKSNVAGQATLCAGLPGSGFEALFNPDCQSRVGNPIPSQTLLNARGGHNINGDDGNINYDAGDITYSTLMLRSELSSYWRNFTFKLSGIGYYDPTNNSFDNDREDLRYPNRGVTRDTITIERPDERRADLEDDLGSDIRTLEAWVGLDFKLADMPVTLRVGDQRLRWGESNLFNFNVLDRVNPLSERLFSMPGVEVRDAFLPVGMATLSMDFTPNFGMQAFYQYDWDRTEPATCGSFLSVSDVAGCGDGPTPVYLSQGQYPEDPLGQFVPGGGDVLLDQGIRTTYLDNKGRGYPDDGGQYGLRLTYYAEWLNGGTEFNFHAMNIHSRLPYLSVDAADETCLDTSIGAGGSVVNNLDPCAGNPNPLARTFPISTVQPFLDYPEDIEIYGISGTTNAGNWSLAGEVAYSPNQPAQVSFADVIFAGLQPAFPDTPAGLMPGTQLNGENALLIPTDRLAVPDYLETRFRGNNVQAGDTVRGFERLEVGQFDMTAIRVFGSSNLIGADSVIFVGEVAAIHVLDMPSIDQLQFEGGTARLLHYSPGSAEYDPSIHGGIPAGSPAAITNCPDPATGCRPVGPTDRINPERADADNFADDFAWGYRMRVDATYSDAIFGTTVKPRLEFFHDVDGTSISPGQDFVDGRKRLTLSNQFLFTNNFSGRVSYRFYWGGGYRNLRLDRDYAEASLSYAF